MYIEPKYSLVVKWTFHKVRKKSNMCGILVWFEIYTYYLYCVCMCTLISCIHIYNKVPMLMMVVKKLTHLPPRLPLSIHTICWPHFLHFRVLMRVVVCADILSKLTNIYVGMYVNIHIIHFISVHTLQILCFVSYSIYVYTYCAIIHAFSVLFANHPTRPTHIILWCNIV